MKIYVCEQYPAPFQDPAIIKILKCPVFPSTSDKATYPQSSTFNGTKNQQSNKPNIIFLFLASNITPASQTTATEQTVLQTTQQQPSAQAQFDLLQRSSKIDSSSQITLKKQKNFKFLKLVFFLLVLFIILSQNTYKFENFFYFEKKFENFSFRNFSWSHN